MSTEQSIREFVTIPKETFDCMLHDFEHLLNDFESISEAETMKIAEKRLSEIKTGKAKTVGMAEFKKFMKNESIE